VTISWIDDLHLAEGSPVLDVGCGAGLTTVSLAWRGYNVEAMDTAAKMLDLTQQAARETGTSARVNTALGDVHQLNYPDSKFSAVLALGVLPWLHSPEIAMAEMVRVLQPGGYLLVTVDNAYRLNHVLDPVYSPMLAWLRRTVLRGLQRIGLKKRPELTPTVARMHTLSRLDRAISAAGLIKLHGLTVGFGPFTFWKRQLFGDRIGTWLHLNLQAHANNGFPILRSTGAHYIVLAQKPYQKR
jgi:ubiquinone/menaquinone biosynthesis C-methylase UbiE